MASGVSTPSGTVASAVATGMLRMPWATPKWSKVRTPCTSTSIWEASSPEAAGAGRRLEAEGTCDHFSPEFVGNTELKLGAHVRSKGHRIRSD